MERKESEGEESGGERRIKDVRRMEGRTVEGRRVEENTGEESVKKSRRGEVRARVGRGGRGNNTRSHHHPEAPSIENHEPFHPKYKPGLRSTFHSKP